MKVGNQISAAWLKRAHEHKENQDPGPLKEHMRR